MYTEYTPFQCNFDLVTNLGTSDEKFSGANRGGFMGEIGKIGEIGEIGK